MALERTFAIIKPNAVKAGNLGRVLTDIEAGGLTPKAMRLTQLTPDLCKQFYAEHVAKPFYPELEAFMVSGPVVVLCLEGDNAILRWRDLMGATNPAKAAPGTLRAKYGEGFTENAVHGSDSPESAARELSFFFDTNDLA